MVRADNPAIRAIRNYRRLFQSCDLQDNQTAFGVRLFLRDNIVNNVSVDVG